MGKCFGRDPGLKRWKTEKEKENKKELNILKRVKYYDIKKLIKNFKYLKDAQFIHLIQKNTENK